MNLRGRVGQALTKPGTAYEFCILPKIFGEPLKGLK